MYYKDMRQRRGEAHYAARLTEKQVLDIREKLEGGAFLRTIAAEYNIGKTTVNNIKQRHTWAWIKTSPTPEGVSE
jgi:DNA invertase Pin-like site-specific DNA recombinase